MAGEWTYAVRTVNRLEDDDEDDQRFIVEFELTGVNATAEVEVFVGPDIDDEAQIIAVAMSQLHIACEAWSRSMAGRRIDDAKGASH